MSYLYLHGFSRLCKGAQYEEIHGIEGPIFAVGAGEVKALVSKCKSETVLPTRKNLRRHAKALEEILSVGPVLPVPFGVVGKRQEQVSALVSRNELFIAMEADRLSGLVELGIRVNFEENKVLQEVVQERRDLWLAFDRANLSQKANHFDKIRLGQKISEILQKKRKDAESILVDALSLMVVDFIKKEPLSDFEVLRGDVLVSESSISHLTGSLEKIARECGFAPRLEPLIQIFGPMPPYSFVKLQFSKENSLSMVSVK